VKLSDSLKYEKAKPMLLSICTGLILFSVVAICMLTVMNTQSKGNYAFAQTVRTTEIKVNFKKVVEAGNNQNIRVFVRDQATGLPISGAIARLTIYYPGGAPIRQFNLLTDRNGFASLTLPISSNAPLGAYGLDVLASTVGFQDTSFGTVNFAVLSHVKEVVNLQDYKHASRTITGIHHHH
jgi:hypothetical protein